MLSWPHDSIPTVTFTSHRPGVEAFARMFESNFDSEAPVRHMNHSDLADLHRSRERPDPEPRSSVTRTNHRSRTTRHDDEHRTRLDNDPIRLHCEIFDIIFKGETMPRALRYDEVRMVEAPSARLRRLHQAASMTYVRDEFTAAFNSVGRVGPALTTTLTAAAACRSHQPSIAPSSYAATGRKVPDPYECRLNTAACSKHEHAP